MNKVGEFIKCHKILVAFFVVVLAVVSWWNYEFPSATWRYKMTVTVETPEGIKTGSAVREVNISYGPTLGDIPTTNVSVKGEAVVVDLGERGKLFATIGEDFAYNVMFMAFPYANGGLTKEGINYYSRLKKAKASILKINALPRFVTFNDLNNPLSAKLVDVGKLSRDFGQGVKVKDITIETSDDPVTFGVVDTYLPWLQKEKGGYLGGVYFVQDAPLGLHTGYFQTGVKND